MEKLILKRIRGGFHQRTKHPRFKVGLKTCGNCKQEKEFSEFYLNNTRWDKMAWACRPCSNLIKRDLYLRHPEVHQRKIETDRSAYKRDSRKTRRSYVKRQYGISMDDYDRMVEAQGNRCAICSTHQDILKKSLAVDHCHKTNTIRKLLCQFCNLGLGFFKENEELLFKAIKYLEENHGSTRP